MYQFVKQDRQIQRFSSRTLKIFFHQTISSSLRWYHHILLIEQKLKSSCMVCLFTLTMLYSSSYVRSFGPFARIYSSKRHKFKQYKSTNKFNLCSIACKSYNYNYIYTLDVVWLTNYPSNLGQWCHRLTQLIDARQKKKSNKNTEQTCQSINSPNNIKHKVQIWMYGHLVQSH